MKKKILSFVAIIAIVIAALSLTACSSGSGFWKLSNIDPENVSKIEIVNSGGTIKVLEGEKLANFMDELGQLPVSKNDNGYPSNSYDYCLRIYLEYYDGYARYYLGQELRRVDIKAGIKESFYEFSDYEAARALVARYFYSE